MKFKLKIPCLALNFFAGAAWSILFWLAVTHFRFEISLIALVMLCVLTTVSLADKRAHQLGLNIACWLAGVIVSAIIEVQTDFAHIILPEWNAGNGLGIIVFIPIFIVTGSLTILAAVITSGIKNRRK